MNKKILPILLCLSFLLLLSGCGKIVPREEYDRVSKELADAKARIASLEKDVAKAEQTYYTMAAYTAFLDVLMYPFVPEDVPTRFNFDTTEAWQEKLKGGATLLKDEKLIEYVDKLGKGEVGVAVIINYILGKMLEVAAS